MKTCKNNVSFDQIINGIVKENYKLFLIYIILLIVIPINTILLPYLVGNLYTKIKNNENILYIFILIILSIIVIQIINISNEIVEIKLMPNIHKYVRELIMNHIFKTRENQFSEVSTGDLISKIVKLPHIVYNYIDYWKNMLIPNIITIIIALIFFIFIDFKLFLLLLSVIIIFILIVKISFDKCTITSLKRDESYTTIVSNVDDILQNILVVMNFNNTNKEFERLDLYQKLYADLTAETMKCSLSAKYIIIPLMISFIIYLTYRSYKLINAKKIDTGKFITMLIVAFILLNIFFNNLSVLKDVYMRWGIIQNTLNDFNHCTIIKEPYNKDSKYKTGINFQDITYGYISDNKQINIFNNLNLVINLNEITIIKGEIGSGKTTLINLIMKYQIPQKGEIFFNNIPYSKIETKIIRDKILYIPQNPILLNRTVYENITYGVKFNITKDLVDDYIDKYNLRNFINSLSNGLDTNVGIHGSKLSGGQKQIIWILKSIIINPEILILDEPTSSIDENTKKIVYDLLKTIMKNKTVIIISHDDNLVKKGDRILTISNGNIIKDEKN